MLPGFELTERAPAEHAHVYAEMAAVPGSPPLCRCCGHVAVKPLTCTVGACAFVGCLGCVTAKELF